MKAAPSAPVVSTSKRETPMLRLRASAYCPRDVQGSRARVHYMYALWVISDSASSAFGPRFSWHIRAQYPLPLYSDEDTCSERGRGRHLADHPAGSPSLACSHFVSVQPKRLGFSLEVVQNPRATMRTSQFSGELYSRGELVGSILNRDRLTRLVAFWGTLWDGSGAGRRVRAG